MIAAPLREPRPASPEPYAPERADEQARRPASRPQTLSGRQPRLNLDSLAIGAPLTAALVGVLLTEGDAAFGNAAADAAGDGSATHRAQDEESAGITGQRPNAPRLRLKVSRARQEHRPAAKSSIRLPPKRRQRWRQAPALRPQGRWRRQMRPRPAARATRSCRATPVSRSAPAHRSKTWGARRQRRR